MTALLPPAVLQICISRSSHKLSFTWTGSSFNCGIRTSQAPESLNARVKKSLSASGDVRLGKHVGKVCTDQKHTWMLIRISL